MKRKELLIIFAAAVLSLLLYGCGGGDQAAQDDSWKKVQEKGELVMGLDENFPPMGFRDEDGEIVGFDVDLAKEVCSRLGIELKLQPIDWDVKEQELNTGKIDCIWNGFTITEDRKKNILFTEPYMKNRQVVVVMADSNYEKLSDLEGKKLGLQAGSSAADALEKAADFKAKLGEIAEFNDNLTALMDLEKGGVDAVLMDEIVARYYMQAKNKNYRVLDEALASEEYGVGFRKNDKELMQKVQETLKAMAEDGTMAEISKKWFGKDITTIK
ncbi:MAG TPA: amino acid ABC transporter substrate-binding protein [Peptococcaceae bacterium]|nr:MAG: Extracellular solute-binding protein family 3 [Clostridia bacterium 41_269]HBT19873.1 amino acid ABC transporter substrate-binding protein [Peptococcaceae bacterium]